MKVRLEESTLVLCHPVHHENVPGSLASRLGVPGNWGIKLAAGPIGGRELVVGWVEKMVCLGKGKE